MRTRVRLIDISQSGALLAADVRLPVGASAQLMTGVGGGPFTPVVAVRRCVGRSESGQPAVGLGATFLEMDAQSRQSLEAFLQRAAK
jgi:hypothetical protein